MAAFRPAPFFRLLDDLLLPIAASDSIGLRQMRAGAADADIVICTDMGTEAADFIICSRRKLIYVHAKCGTSERPRSSAGALAEVGSQAVKNIEHLISKNTGLKFGNASMLDSVWPTPGADGGLDRLRVFRDELGRDRPRVARNGDSPLKQALGIVTSRRLSDACEKEIWVVVGRGFSLRNFSQQLANGADANSNTLQAFQLVSAWDAAAREGDIALRFFVSP